MPARQRNLKPLALAGLALGLLLAGCAQRITPDATSPSLLQGWAADDHPAALDTFLVSCPTILRRDPSGPLGGVEGAGDTATWQHLCRTAATTPPQRARMFFEQHFKAVPQARSPGVYDGLFTGYFEPLLNGSRWPTAQHRYPLHQPPRDLQRRRGQPLLARASIDRGALAQERLELVWVDDPVAKFFLQIQGSGQVQLTDGNRIRVGYAGQNGHGYHAIGRDLIDAGYVPRELMSMQAIDTWLRTAHPDQAWGLMHRNPSYVFFQELGPVEGSRGPNGAMGLPVTPGRSIAVDRHHNPLGGLVWIDTTEPTPEGLRPLRRLMVAQDVGGAIRGPVRGDVFYGAGPEAAFTAGHMQHPGRLWQLVPR
ncbi:MAG: murein transglycosylase [Geminicoccaceae bacterium]|nr:MAG: murein transglycosylase [Geminicoccaceae bacterium]